MSAYVPDPRIAAVTAVGVEGDMVIMDDVNIDGRLIQFPRLLPGAPEYAAVFASERRAEELRPRLVEDLDERHQPPWQPNTPLVVGMASAAGTVVTNSMMGLEAFANHFILRSAPEGMLTYSGGQITVEDAFNWPVNQRYSDLLPELTQKSTPTGEWWWSTFRCIQRLAVLQRHAIYGMQPSGKGLRGERTFPERIYNGEYRGAASMMVSAFEHFSPGWLSDERRQALENTDV